MNCSLLNNVCGREIVPPSMQPLSLEMQIFARRFSGYAHDFTYDIGIVCLGSSGHSPPDISTPYISLYYNYSTEVSLPPPPPLS